MIASATGSIVTQLADCDADAQGHLRLTLLEPDAATGLADGLDVLVPGEAEGVLVGGNLAVLAAGVGAPAAMPAWESIAFLEDIGEDPYRIDRLLTQLRRSGWLDRVRGVVTQIGVAFEADAVVLTTGTFLSGLIHVGLQNYEAGRAGDPPAKQLAARLRELALPVGRLKTGTPPRLDGRTIDCSGLEVQPGDDPPPIFSFVGSRAMHPRQVACWITHTNARTHDVIRAGLDRR